MTVLYLQVFMITFELGPNPQTIQHAATDLLRGRAIDDKTRVVRGKCVDVDNVDYNDDIVDDGDDYDDGKDGENGARDWHEKFPQKEGTDRRLVMLESAQEQSGLKINQDLKFTRSILYTYFF